MAGEADPLAGADAALARALLVLHPQLKGAVCSVVRFGEHARFPGAKCFLVLVNGGQRDERIEPASFKKVRRSTNATMIAYRIAATLSVKKCKVFT